MGCAASKEAIDVGAKRRRQPKQKQKAASTGMHRKVKTSPRDAPKLSPSNSLRKLRSSWKIQRGYSSGASSCSGSETGGSGEDLNADQSGAPRERIMSDTSRHSDILALSMLRHNNVNDGDMAKAVVRIETPLDTPIEEIYDGVLNGTVLGSGVSGIVRLVEHRETGVKYAVKCMDLGLINTTEGLLQLRNEISIMCQLDHPNIVRIEEVYMSSNEIYIVQELCVGGDLFDRLEQQENYHYTEAQCAKMVKQMLSAVRYLHSKGIVHRDLKLENFLFSAAGSDSELKMIDFGFSKHFEIGQCHNEKVGTPYTVAPEIIKGNYDEKCDMWSLGVITYLLLSGETPFGGLDGESMQLVKQNIIRAKVSFTPVEIWDLVSEEGKKFTSTLLNADPTQRPTAKEGQRCEWIQVWAKKDDSEGNILNPKTVGALIEFKQSSDMQKLLSEVLSFTLLPEQIVDLRKEFEKMDSHGDGEISLGSLKRVLMQNAEVGALGALTEQEVEEIFDSLRVGKSNPKIRWHEFLAASLSQAQVDDRNLRLAFGRLDNQRKGFVTCDDLVDILGNSTEYDALQKIWKESLEEVKSHLDRITFDDFKHLMKGQIKEPHNHALSIASSTSFLPGVPEGEEASESALYRDDASSRKLLELLGDPNKGHRKRRSSSFEQLAASWSPNDHAASMAIKFGHDSTSSMTSNLAANRALYRTHREMRMAVLSASMQFDKKRTDFQTSNHNNSNSRHHQSRASLVMKRGSIALVKQQDESTRALFHMAAEKSGRERKKNKKTVSDITEMLMRSPI